VIEKAIFTRLSGATSITSLTSTRIYNQLLPQEIALPAIVFFRVSTSREDLAHSGAMGLAETIIQISVYSSKVTEIRTLSDEIRKRLHGFKGTVSGVSILLSKMIQERDFFDSELNIFQEILEFQIKYREATS